MNDSLREQIYSRMSLKETDELLEIWQVNDRAEWSDTAFQVIEEILKHRGIEIPQQGQPTFEHNEEDSSEKFDFSEIELKVIDDENPPAFYEPLDVIKTVKQIGLAANVMIGLIIIYNLANFSTPFNIARSYFYDNPNSLLIYLVTAGIVIINAAIGALIAYFPLIALSRILMILMEMEFNSRKANS